MTKLEKLRIELSRCQQEINMRKEKEIILKEKIRLEEQKEIQKMMDAHHLTLEDLSAMIKRKI